MTAGGATSRDGGGVWWRTDLPHETTGSAVEAACHAHCGHTES